MSVMVGNESYSRVVKDKNGKPKTSWVTAGEANALNQGNNEFRFDVTPFDDDSSIFDYQGIKNGEFILFNSSQTDSYDLSNVNIYQGINQSYFGGSQFDSPAAIATGTLLFDVSAQTPLSIGPNDGSPFDPYLSIPIGDVNTGSYYLLVGVANQILPDGSNGPPVDFSMAFSITPEPSSWVLLLLGVGGIGGALRSRGRVDARQPVHAS